METVPLKVSIYIYATCNNHRNCTMVLLLLLRYYYCPGHLQSAFFFSKEENRYQFVVLSRCLTILFCRIGQLKRTLMWLCWTFSYRMWNICINTIITVIIVVMMTVIIVNALSSRACMCVQRWKFFVVSLTSSEESLSPFP